LLDLAKSWLEAASREDKMASEQIAADAQKRKPERYFSLSSTAPTTLRTPMVAGNKEYAGLEEI
jgi:hypothetical protein